MKIKRKLQEENKRNHVEKHRDQKEWIKSKCIYEAQIQFAKLPAGRDRITLHNHLNALRHPEPNIVTRKKTVKAVNAARSLAFSWIWNELSVTRAKSQGEPVHPDSIGSMDPLRIDTRPRDRLARVKNYASIDHSTCSWQLIVSDCTIANEVGETGLRISLQLTDSCLPSRFSQQ